MYGDRQMTQRATRSRPDSQSQRHRTDAGAEHPRYGDESGAGPLVKHIYSVMLTTGHVDVTDVPVMYAPPKKFVFISKNQMKWIDANRWCRQGARDAKIVPVEDITSERFSIDNRTSATDVSREPRESAPRIVRGGLIRA
jgi:hypothetical protein